MLLGPLGPSGPRGPLGWPARPERLERPGQYIYPGDFQGKSVLNSIKDIVSTIIVTVINLLYLLLHHYIQPCRRTPIVGDTSSPRQHDIYIYIGSDP